VFLNLLFAMIIIFVQQIVVKLASVFINPWCVILIMYATMLVATKPLDNANKPRLIVMTTTCVQQTLARSSMVPVFMLKSIAMIAMPVLLILAAH
jgi:hypothetical protein